MASAELSRRVEKIVSYPPLSELGDLQRHEFHEALLWAASFEDLPGRWQAAILPPALKSARAEAPLGRPGRGARVAPRSSRECWPPQAAHPRPATTRRRRCR
jgi:hypothetical protein